MEYRKKNRDLLKNRSVLFQAVLGFTAYRAALNGDIGTGAIARAVPGINCCFVCFVPDIHFGLDNAGATDNRGNFIVGHPSLNLIKLIQCDGCAAGG